MKIIEAEACPDHIHLFVEIPPKLSISGFMGYLKGKSSTMLYEQFGEVQVPQQRILVQGVLCGYGRKERDPNCGVYVYIKNQLKEDELGEQMTIASIGPFTGGK